MPSGGGPRSVVVYAAFEAPRRPAPAEAAPLAPCSTVDLCWLWGQPRCLRLGVWRPSPSAALAYGRTLRRRVAGPLCLRRGRQRTEDLALCAPIVNSARPPPEVSGVDRRILRTNDLGPGLLVPYATLAIILACEAKAGLALLPSLAERLPRHSCSTHCWAPFPALQDASAAPQWPQRESAHGERARTRRTRTLG
jgi:hypothetical protein